MIKKNLKKIMIIILIILLMIISLGIGAYADYVLNATEVQYTRNGSTKSVKAALDELYNNSVYESSNYRFTIGEEICVGAEHFWVISESPKTESTVKAWAVDCLIKDSTTGKYRQIVSGETPQDFQISDVDYVSVLGLASVSSNVNCPPTIANDGALAVVNSYCSSIGALKCYLPAPGELKTMQYHYEMVRERYSALWEERICSRYNEADRCFWGCDFDADYYQDRFWF